MDFYKEASDLKDEIVRHRRYFHRNAEVGMTLPYTSKYIEKALASYGIECKRFGGGLVGILGSGDSTVLLRADMDALPMKEQSGEEFTSCSESTAHTCGHDLHAAMLLGSAKILSKHRKHLQGRVAFMFQPGEEVLKGCADMIGHGLIDDLAPSAALAIHTGAGRIPPGVFMYNAGGVMMFSADTFRIDISGKGGHGAYSHLSSDPIRIGNSIYSALESLMAKERNPIRRASLSIGRFSGGTAGNVIPESAVIEGSLRTDDSDERERLCKRITEACKQCAESLGGTASVSFTAGVPPLVCDRDLTERAVSYMRELSVPWRDAVSDLTAAASEDFSLIAEKIPSTYIYLSAGFDDSRGDSLAHDPRVRFNEDVLPIGAAVYSQFAVRFLEDSSKKKR